MDSQRRGRVQRDADGAMIRCGLVEQRMQMAHRQHQGQEQKDDAGGDGDFADAG